MTVQLYNTLSRQIEPVPFHGEREIGFYACGITAYDYAHLGNLRRYVMDDLIIRALRYDGYRVKFVQNVTDVGHLVSDEDEGEDKLEKGARREKASVFEIARKFEDYFYQVNERMGNFRPDVVARASDYIQQQLQIVIDLEKKGYAYLIAGDGLYFDTSKSEGYGALAQLDLVKLKEGARVDKIAGKRNPSDFALWKLERPGENRQMAWPSPWGERSFPGWHLECVAMSIAHLGPQFEIHSGGVDHIPVHHTNEIAQAEAWTDKKPFVKMWLHHNFMLVDGQKMSKSLGNIYRLEDIIDKGFSPMALRYLLMMTHYQKEMNFTWEALAGAQKAYERLIVALARLQGERVQSMAMEDDIERANHYRQRFLDLVNHNLDLPQALALLGDILKANLGGGERYSLIIELDHVLGLQLRQNVAFYLQNQEKASALKDSPHKAKAEELLFIREKARSEKDFVQADSLRQEIEALGFMIEDTPEGAKLKKK